MTDAKILIEEFAAKQWQRGLSVSPLREKENGR